MSTPVWEGGGQVRQRGCRRVGARQPGHQRLPVGQRPEHLQVDTGQIDHGTQHLGGAVRIEVRGGAVTDTPALRNAAERNRRQREAEQIIHDDAAVRSLMAQYPGARIVPGSVKYQ